MATTAQIAAKPWIIPAIFLGYAGKKPEVKLRLVSEKISRLTFGANFPDLVFGFGLYQLLTDPHSGEEHRHAYQHPIIGLLKNGQPREIINISREVKSIGA